MPFPEQIELVNVTSSGEQADDGIYLTSFSKDGRFLVFRSHASDLVEGDTNGQVDVFVRDLQEGTTERVSVSSTGEQANNFTAILNSAMYSTSISNDSRFVLFSSYATDLVEGDTNGQLDIFVRDLQERTTERVNVSSSGEQATSGFSSYNASFSDDGRFVLFSSTQTNLVEGDTNERSDFFVRDLQEGTTERVSVSNTGEQANEGSYQYASFSNDARFVLFSSSASNLVEGDTNGEVDIFVRDLQGGTTIRANVSSSGEQANDPRFFNASFSSDGRFVVFSSYATNLVEEDTNGEGDIFVRDLQEGTTDRLIVSSSGEQANGGSSIVSLSEDDRFVLFHSLASNLVEGDTNGESDLFVRDLQEGTTVRVNVSSSDEQTNSGFFSNFSNASFSDDGRFVVFSSTASNLVEGDTNGQVDVFVRDLQEGTTARVNVSNSGEQANSGSYLQSFSDDGRYVLFSSRASNLVEGDTNDRAKSFLAPNPLYSLPDEPTLDSDYVQEGIDTSATLTENVWVAGRIDAEPISGDGVTSDGAGGLVDKDWYAVTLTANRTYAFSAESVSLSTGSVFVRLYDSAGIVVGGTTFGEGSTPSFTHSTAGQSGTQTYYLAVGAGDDNDSDFLTATGDFLARFTDDGVVENQPPSVIASSITVAPDTAIPLDGNTNPNGLFIWSDPDGVSDVVTFSVADQSVGGGYLTRDGERVAQDEGTTITNIPMSEIGRYAFVSGLDGEFDNIGFAVADSSSNTSDATVAFVESGDGAPVLQKANTLELEYFARESAYDRGPLGGVSASVLGTNDLQNFLSGWSVQYVFGSDTDNFRAVTLVKESFHPVLAFRGSSNLSDWGENFDVRGVAATEFSNGLLLEGTPNPRISGLQPIELQEWMANNSGFSITGHSQGGAQAQLAAVFAATNGIRFTELVTFNSPGIDDSLSQLNGIDPDVVTHFVNASDVVSLVGERFVPGEIVYYDNSDQDFGWIDIGLQDFIGPLSTLYSAHAAHWSQIQLHAADISGLNIYSNSGLVPFLPAPNPLSAGPSLADFHKPDYSALTNYGQDDEYIGLLTGLVAVGYAIDDLEDFVPLATRGTLGIPQTLLNLINDEMPIRQFVDDILIPAFSSRGDLEAARVQYGSYFEIFFNAAQTIVDVVTQGLDLIFDGFDVIGRAAELAFDITTAFGQAILDTPEAIVDGLVLIANSVHGIGSFIQDTVEDVAITAWEASTEAIGQLFDRSPVTVVDGVHSESTPAIVLNSAEGPGEALSSVASGTIFILTDPETQISLTSGNNVVWGLATDFAGTNISGGISPTDEMFIQNATFETNDLQREDGSAIIGVDLDQDGAVDITITWEGDYRLESIVAEQVEDGTYIRYLGDVLQEPITAVLDNGDSNINVDGATAGFTDFGGQDTYTVLNSLSADVTITDNNPSVINLPEGLAISSALFLADGLQFTVNGNTLTFLGDPSSFEFKFGGTPLNPAAGTAQTFAQTATAFGTSIPNAGAGPNTATITGAVQADGSVTNASSLTQLIGVEDSALDNAYSYF